MGFHWFSALLLAMLVAPHASAQSVQTREQALAQDAGEYGRLYGVAPDEALRRLHAQHDSIPATDAIAERYRNRLAGISIQHRPDYRIVVYLTGDEAVPEQRIRAGGMIVPITFRTGAKASRERVVWAITYHQAAINAALPSPPSMGLDPRTGELVVIAGTAVAAQQGGAAALDAKLTALTGVPVQVRVMERTDVNLGLHGGSRVDGIDPANGKRYRCTTGFAVREATRSGITTAAHCHDAAKLCGAMGLGLSRRADLCRRRAGAAADLFGHRPHCGAPGGAPSEPAEHPRGRLCLPPWREQRL